MFATMAGHGLFVGAAAFGAALTLITEALSLGHRLTPVWLGAGWALAAAARARGPSAGRGARRTARSRGRCRCLEATTWALGAILAVTGAIALLAPPNTWDSMTYHMPRVAHWSQAGSVAHYPTHILRQLWLGPWARSSRSLHLYLLTGGDRLANLVQWLAFAGCVAGSGDRRPASSAAAGWRAGWRRWRAPLCPWPSPRRAAPRTTSSRASGSSRSATGCCGSARRRRAGHGGSWSAPAPGWPR